MALSFFPKETLQEIFLHVKFEITRSICHQWKDLSDELELKRCRINITQKMLKSYISSRPLRFNMFNIFFVQGDVYCSEATFKLNNTNDNNYVRGFEYGKKFFNESIEITFDELVTGLRSKDDIVISMNNKKRFYLPGTDLINYFINKHPVFHLEKKDIKNTVLKLSLGDYHQMIIKSPLYDSKIVSHKFLSEFFLKKMEESEFLLP
jgi:hypothetical protein